MNVLIIGSGGREHTLTWKIAQSSQCEQIFIAPGNAGTSTIGTNLPLDITDFQSIADAIIEHNVSLLVIGPEDPLVNGLRDFLQGIPTLNNLLIVGPDANGAQLEGSKDFSKKFMQKFNIPSIVK